MVRVFQNRDNPMRRVPILLAAACSMVAALAHAEVPPELQDKCFARIYDEAHLAAHPGQEVTSIAVWLSDFEDDLFAGIALTKRGSDAPYTYSATCYRPVAGGYACDGCAGDSCESNSETFKLLVRGEGRIDLVNDETGITTVHYDGEADTETPFRLTPGGEHGDFALSAAPDSACGE